MQFSMTHDVDRAATPVREFLSLAQFRQDPDLIWLALKRLGGANPDETFKKVLDFESRNDVPSTWFVQVGLLSENTLKPLRDAGCEVAIHPTSMVELESRGEIERVHGLRLSGFRMHYHRLGPRVLERAARVGYLYDSSLYGGTAPLRLPGGILEIPVTFEDGYIVHLYRVKNAKTLIAHTVSQYIEDKEAVFTFNFHQNSLARKREWKLFEFVIDLAREYGIPFITCRNIVERTKNSYTTHSSYCSHNTKTS